MSLHTSLSTRQSLLLTALATAITTTSLILSFQALRREHRTERLKRAVGEDVEEWEKSRAGSGVGSPEDVAERMASEGVRKEWGQGEYDEGLVREQVGSPDVRRSNRLMASFSLRGITNSWERKVWRR